MYQIKGSAFGHHLPTNPFRGGSPSKLMAMHVLVSFGLSEPKGTPQCWRTPLGVSFRGPLNMASLLCLLCFDGQKMHPTWDVNGGSKDLSF